MRKSGLTYEQIIALPFRNKRELIALGHVIGFYVEIATSGNKTYNYRYLLKNGKRRMMKIGDVDHMPLDEAIEKAKDCRKAVRVKGVDPLETELRAKPVIQQNRDFITSLFGTS